MHGKVQLVLCKTISCGSQLAGMCTALGMAWPWLALKKQCWGWSMTHWPYRVLCGLWMLKHLWGCVYNEIMKNVLEYANIICFIIVGSRVGGVALRVTLRPFLRQFCGYNFVAEKILHA